MTFLIVSIVIFAIAYVFYAYVLFKHNGTDSDIIKLFFDESLVLVLLISGYYLIGGGTKAFLPRELAEAFLLGAVLAVVLAVQVLYRSKNKGY